ncbi:hypothetical protein EX895_000637 [Sporisorium graminicola]|uniref:Uncharacterized protein n=1 Tax=Sporisorium graminicola TaxID=280036 RepID=A0A4V6EUH5_9BASI|nr:hypothetical protein EX895_000637 [Sporisorium graminicola]TKY90639.1 hypothetical protein EX895_000637 [Sporisorium graminicola]
MILLQPQRPAPARSSIGSSRFGRKNSSVASFASSSNDDYDPPHHHQGSGAPGMYRDQQSRSSREHSRGHPASPYSTQLPPASLTATTDESSDVEYSNNRSGSTWGRRRGSSTKKGQSQSHDSSLTKEGASSNKSSGVGTLKGFGRRLFNRSSSNLKPAPLLAMRSHSASSGSTNAQSPPLTPTTPPPVQPVWLPNGQKDFFANFSGLPSSIALPHVQPLRTSNADSTLDISPKSRQAPFSDSVSYDYTQRESTSSSGHGSSSAFSHHSSSNAFSLPAVPTATAAPVGFSSSSQVARREIHAVIEEEGDTDFLRAVLNFGESEAGEEAPQQTPSFRGGRAAPLPARSSSLSQIAGLTGSPSAYASPSSLFDSRPPSHRTLDGRMVLTQKAAKDFAIEKPKSSYVVVHRKYRKGLFGTDSDSEDEYGNEDEGEGETTMVSPAERRAPAAVKQVDRVEEPARYPSSFAKSRTHSPSNEAQARSGPGLDTAAKKAVYNCTLLKVHMHLAPTLAGDADSRALIPVIAAGEVLYSNEDLKFPRSINAESSLRQHSSTYGFARNLHVALARTGVMRKLRRDRLSIDEEVEISWFQRRYGSASIATDQIAKALRQRQMVSPEALAKPPIAVMQEAANRRLSSEGVQKGDRNGIVVWAQRPTFADRTMVLLPADEFAPGEVMVQGAKLAVQVGAASSAAAASPTTTVNFSPRIRTLAGLPSVEEERRIKYSLASRRPRDTQSRRASRLGSASDGAVWEGPERRAARGSPLASPSQKSKRLPPWMAPASPQLLSPHSMSQLRPARSASEGLTAFATMHQNSSTSSIPEVSETPEQADDSSDEEVPLAQLQTFRAHRSAEKERIMKLESEIAQLKQKENVRDKEEEERKKREEEARRIEAERAYEERKAILEARKLEKNRRILQEARDRRGFTRQSVLQAEPNYGAGNPLLMPHSNSRLKEGSSPSSPNLHEPMSPPSTVGARATQHDAALAKLQGNRLASRSTTTLYAQQEGQRRSKTSVVAGAATPSPVQEQVSLPMLNSASPLVDLQRLDLQRHASMVNLAVPSTPVQQTLPHRRSMAALPAVPQVAPRRASLMPPPAPHVPIHEGTVGLHHATSMHHLGAGNMHHMPSSPSMLLASPNALMQQYADPRLSMSMTNLHAQAYVQAQQQQQHAQQMMGGVQRPTMAQTAKVSSRPRSRMPPLVSLYGDVVPSSALSAQQQQQQQQQPPWRG